MYNRQSERAWLVQANLVLPWGGVSFNLSIQHQSINPTIFFQFQRSHVSESFRS